MIQQSRALDTSPPPFVLTATHGIAYRRGCRVSTIQEIPYLRNPFLAVWCARSTLQGYLAHKKHPPPKTQGVLVVPGERAVFYERGTPVA